MIYIVIATIPDLILRIGFALMLSPDLEVRESGWRGVRVDRSNCIDDYFLSESKKWIWNEKCRWSEMTGGVFLFVY